MAAKLKLATAVPADGPDTILGWARSYAELGFKLVPCWGVIPVPGSTKWMCACPKGAACTAPGKHPNLDAMFGGAPKTGPDDTYLTRATDDLGQIDKWLTAYPHSNLAMAVRQSKKLVLDLDNKNGKRGTTTFEELVWIFGDEVKGGPAQHTGSDGMHYFYDGTGLSVDFANQPNKGGIDVLYNSHVLLSPSRNVNGLYRPVAGQFFGDVKLQSWKVVEPFLRPDALHKLCIGDVGDRHTECYGFGRNVKLQAKRRSHSITEDRLQKRVHDALRYKYEVRGLANLKPGDPFTLDELDKIEHSVLTTPDRELKAEVAAFDFAGFTRLIQYTTDPPYWEIFYDDVSIKVDTKTLFSWQLLRLRVGEVLRKVLPPTIKNADWSLYLSTLMDSCEVISAPDDASEAGMLREYLIQFLKKARLTETGEVPEERATLRRGLPIVHVRAGDRVKGVAFGGNSFTRYLQMQYRFRMRQHEIWAALGQLGVDYFSLKIPSHDGGKATSEKVWFVPLDQVPSLLDEGPKAPDFKSEM